MRLVDLGPITFFISYKLNMGSEKHLEDISFAHIISLMYILITGAKDTDDLSIGPD